MTGGKKPKGKEPGRRRGKIKTDRGAGAKTGDGAKEGSKEREGHNESKLGRTKERI